jgi:hypothetical protein
MKKPVWLAAAGTAAATLLAAALWSATRKAPAEIPNRGPSPPDRLPKPKLNFAGDPGEIITIIKNPPYVVNTNPYFGVSRMVGAGPRLYQTFSVCNKRGNCISSDAFNAETRAGEREVLNDLMVKLHRAGWQHLSGLSLKYAGLASE